MSLAPPDTPPEVMRMLVDHRRELLEFIERRTGSRALAEDILQDAFVRNLDKVDTLHSEESVVAWFYRVLRNAVVDHHRRRQASAAVLRAFATEPDQASETREEITREICRCVGQLATTLKPEYAEALQAVEVRGEPVKEFAKDAGISPSNAGVRVFRAREALRRQVLRACGACAKHGCVDCTCASAT